MSGHSKWHSIKHKKAAVDAKRGQMFTRLIREITVAAKQGGGDPDGNPRLRTAVAAARAANMPLKNIDNAIKKGTGDLPGVVYEEITYEGYGPGGVAILVESATDNKNRTSAEVRHAFSKYNGSMGEAGCVQWMFSKKGRIEIAGGGVNEDELMLAALDAGAEDVARDGDAFTVTTAPAACADVQAHLAEAGYKIDSAEVAYVPKNTVKVSEKEGATLLNLLNVLEELDDTQSVSANFDIDEALLEKLSA